MHPTSIPVVVATHKHSHHGQVPWVVTFPTVLITFHYQHWPVCLANSKPCEWLCCLGSWSLSGRAVHRWFLKMRMIAKGQKVWDIVDAVFSLGLQSFECQDFQAWISSGPLGKVDQNSARIEPQRLPANHPIQQRLSSLCRPLSHLRRHQPSCSSFTRLFGSCTSPLSSSVTKIGMVSTDDYGMT